MKYHVSIVLLIVSSFKSVGLLNRSRAAGHSLQKTPHLAYQLSAGISRRRRPHAEFDVLLDPRSGKIGGCHDRFTPASSPPGERQIDFRVQPDTCHDDTAPRRRVTRQTSEECTCRGGYRD